MLSLDRLTAAIAAVAVKVAALDATAASELDAAMAIDFEEHFAFQTQQSTAHAEQLLSTDAALLIYRSLGEVRSQQNGGWRDGVDTATKVVITQLMTELLERRIQRKRTSTFATGV